MQGNFYDVMKNTECIVFERTRDTEPENPRSVCVFVSSVLIPSLISRRVDSFASYAYSCCICSLECFIAYRLRFGKTGNKKLQLVLQNCCKTSWIAMLGVLLPTSNLSCNKSGWTGLNVGGKSATYSFCSSVAKHWPPSRPPPRLRSLFLLTPSSNYFS